MMTSSVRLRGPNSFACFGVASLLKEMASTLPAYPPLELTIVVLTRMALPEIMKYCQQLNPAYDYIVIGDTQAQALLVDNTTLKIIAFIDTALPLLQMREALHQVLTTSQDVDIRTEPAFTLRERVVLNYLKRGMNVTQIASVMGLNVKTISAHKRNTMKKLGVANNLTLYCKLAFMNALDKQYRDEDIRNMSGIETYYSIRQAAKREGVITPLVL